MHRACFLALGGLSLTFASNAFAELPVERTFFQLASSNGHGAVMLDLSQAKLTHFRERLPAAEEPLLDSTGTEVWVGNQPQFVASRDLLYDAYFGLRANGTQAWLTGTSVDFDKSGYAAWTAGKTGGTGIATMVQQRGAIEATQYFFAPLALAEDGFVMAIHVKNTSASTATGVSLFSIHNFHLGYGRPGVMADIGDNGETITYDNGAGRADFVELGFAGVVVARALAAPTHHGESDSSSASTANVFDIVNAGGTTDLPDLFGAAPTADGSVGAFQLDVGDLAAGADAWFGVAFAHHGDPFEGTTAQGYLDAYVGAQTAKELVDAEIAAWAQFQQGLQLPAGVSADEETLLRQSAAMLKMAQATESSAYLREFLTMDGEPRYTRFGATLGAAPATLPATIAHRGAGQVIASLPPGEWTVTWSRDSAYSATAMSTLGMNDEAKAALLYSLNAEAGRFQKWNELMPYAMPPYQVSLVRYYGFGVEETDENDFGPNLEFDGLGLFLWATHHYEESTGDTSLVDQNWTTISTKVADVLVALVDPNEGLIQKDSSIWESHWDGRQRSWAYTDIAAVRGLCDASTLAARVGDTKRATTYAKTADALRKAIVAKLTDHSHAIASNVEELGEGNGYWDAAVLEGIAMGLFDPKGIIAKATLNGIDDNLQSPAGAGWSRNDDRTDHAGGNDLSPWGSDYDSAEWVFTDLRGAVATRLMGDDSRSDRLLSWVRRQSLANYLAISETYDETTGLYKFNAPMIGFGAGAYALALVSRDKPLDAPACGAYFDESGLSSTSSSSSGSSGGAGPTSGTGVGGFGATGVGGGGGAGAADGATETGGCGCRTEGGAQASFNLGVALLAALALARRLRSRRAR